MQFPYPHRLLISFLRSFVPFQHSHRSFSFAIWPREFQFHSCSSNFIVLRSCFLLVPDPVLIPSHLPPTNIHNSKLSSFSHVATLYSNYPMEIHCFKITLLEVPFLFPSAFRSYKFILLGSNTEIIRAQERQFKCPDLYALRPTAAQSCNCRKTPAQA